MFLVVVAVCIQGSSLLFTHRNQAVSVVLGGNGFGHMSSWGFCEKTFRGVTTSVAGMGDLAY